MSLLIKALDKAQDKAQEQAQLAKLKQMQNNNALKNSQVDSQIDSLPASTQGYIATKQKPLPVKLADSTNLTLEPSVEAKTIASNSIEELRLQDTSPPQLNLSSSRLSTDRANPGTINKVAVHNAAKQSAANVFNAKNSQQYCHSKTNIVMAITGSLALLAIGMYFYQLENKPFYAAPISPLPSPINLETVIPKQSQNEAAPLKSLAMPIEQNVFVEPVIASNEVLAAEFKAVNKAIEPLKLALKKDQLVDKSPSSALNPEPNLVTSNLKTAATQDITFKNFGSEQSVNEISPMSKQATEISLDTDEVLIAVNKPKNSNARINKQRQKNKELDFNSPVIASESASMRVTKTQSQNSINPVLISAYEAYNAGNDPAALKLYKQVLQRDVRNSDALLGLGAIAQRQGRLADASGWYSKVLEVDPKNTAAISFLLDNQMQNQPVNQNESTETQLKNMLATKPNDANLHALLGNLYAQNDQWPAAQQAYFDAYRHNASAENALNLAVSLDQMGKPALALPYYQQALNIAQEQAQSGRSQIDKTSIEARINAIN